MFALLSFFFLFQAMEGFRATWTLEEGAEKRRYSVDFKPGALRVSPESTDVSVLIDTTARTITLLRNDEGVYCRFDPDELRRFTQAGAIDLRWFPWVYDVGPDIVDDLELRSMGMVRLPDGRLGRRWSAYSKTYDRVVADYWLDSEIPAERFFQWRTVYFDLSGRDDPEQVRAQEHRLELYSRFDGFPVKMEERFRLLSRARILRMESREPLPANAFDVPTDYRQKTPAELLWEDWVERWLRPKASVR